MLNHIVAGLTQPPQMMINSAGSVGLLLAFVLGSHVVLTEHVIGAYLALQLLWWLLLWIRASRAVGSRSECRKLDERWKQAFLKWMDVLRFGVAELICNHILHVELGTQVCMLYCEAAALRAVAKPFLYVILRMSVGSKSATVLTGFDPMHLLESVGWHERTERANGPAWKQHGEAGGAGARVTSAQVRVSSLAPTRNSDSAQKNNNNLCTVLDEGPHFNRTSRGCLLKYVE